MHQIPIIKIRLKKELVTGENLKDVTCIRLDHIICVQTDALNENLIIHLSSGAKIECHLSDNLSVFNFFANKTSDTENTNNELYFLNI